MLLATWVLLQTWEQQPPVSQPCCLVYFVPHSSLSKPLPGRWQWLHCACDRWNHSGSLLGPLWKLAQETAVARNLQQQGCFYLSFLHPNDGSNRMQSEYIVYTCVQPCLQQGCRTSCPPTQSYCFALYRIFCFRSMPEYQPHFRGKTHTAADGIWQFPTTNKHPTSSDECHSDMISHHSIQNLQDLGNYESLMPVSLPCHPFHPLSWHLGLSSSPWRHCSCSSHRPGEGAVTPTLHMRSEWQPLSDLDSKIHCTTITMSS